MSEITLERVVGIFENLLKLSKVKVSAKTNSSFGFRYRFDISEIDKVESLLEKFSVPKGFTITTSLIAEFSKTFYLEVIEEW